MSSTGSIKRLLQQARLPEQLVAAVRDELTQLLAHSDVPMPLAVRSNGGVGEDAETRSFAWQFHSVLDMRPELSSVLDAYRLEMVGQILGFTRVLDAAMTADMLIEKGANAFLTGNYELSSLKKNKEPAQVDR